MNTWRYTKTSFFEMGLIPGAKIAFQIHRRMEEYHGKKPKRKPPRGQISFKFCKILYTIMKSNAQLRANGQAIQYL